MTTRYVEPSEDVVLYRSLDLRMEHLDEETREFTFSASSEFAADRWGITEILSHEEGAVRLERLREIGSILLNHDATTIAASIVRAEIINKRLMVTGKFTTTQRGMDAFTEVKENALRGISAGYVVHKWEIDEENDIYRAIEWTPYEVSLTPIPVDDSVGIGRSEDENLQTKEAFYKSINRSLSKGVTMPTEPTNTPAGDPASAPITENTPAVRSVEPAAAPVVVVSAPVVDEAQIAAGIRADVSFIAGQAESLGLEASSYLSLSRSEASDKMIADVATRDHKEPIANNVIMGDSAVDKRNEHFSAQLASGQAGCDSLITYAREAGISGIHTRQDIVDAVLGVGRFANQRALETSSSLGNVTILAGDKAMITGFDSYVPWHTQIAAVRNVPDFKTVHSAGLTIGGWNYPGEGNALADGTMDDAGNTGSVAYGGVTLRLTKEALINDDLDLFFDRLRNIGRNARREEDKIIVSTLEAYTFTTTHLQTTALSKAALDTAWTLFAEMKDPSGENIGLDAAKLVCPPALFLTGAELTTTALGEATNRILADSQALMPVNAKGLTDANDWYLAADPRDSNGIQLLKLRSQQQPMIVEIDSGAVIARQFRVEYPLGAMINEVATGHPVGIVKSEVA